MKLKKKTSFVIISLVLVLCFSLSSLAYADSDDDKVSTSAAIYYDYPMDILSLISSKSNFIEGELVDVKQTKQVVTPSDANGLKSIMLTLLGDYETVTTDYTYQTSSNYYSHSITTERDWAWIMSCALFIVVIWCVFRGVVAILCRR